MFLHIRNATRALNAKLHHYKDSRFCRRRLRRLIHEQLEDRRLMNVDWRNPVNSVDINDDNRVAPLDALLVINEMNANGIHDLPNAYDPQKPHFDADGNQAVQPRDALLVINALNRRESPAVILEESSSLTSKYDVTVTVGQTSGSRLYRVGLEPSFDKSDTLSHSHDVLAVYLLDPLTLSETLVDRGTPGTSLFSLSEDHAEFTPGRVRWDGHVAEFDLSSIQGRDTAILRFQLINNDGDTQTKIAVTPLSNKIDVNGAASPSFPLSKQIVGIGPAINLSTLSQSPDVRIELENVRFDEIAHRFKAEMNLINRGAAIGSTVAVVFDNLSTGVQLLNPSGTNGAGKPYLNFSTTLARGGLGRNERSAAVPVELDIISKSAFGFKPSILSSVNHAPVLDPIATLTTTPGAVLHVLLHATDQNNDRVEYSLVPVISPTIDGLAKQLPTGSLESDGDLVFRPTKNEIGTFKFDVIASDGVTSVKQTVTLNVVRDTKTTTRITGKILNIDQTPIVGMTVSIGTIQALTKADGGFTLDLGAGTPPSDTIKVRGDLFGGSKAYPFIAEKLPLLLQHDVYTQVNNVIDRPIYLPVLDIANAKTIDPTKDTAVTTAAIPDMSVMVKANSLMNQQGTPFTGKLSITEVSVGLTPAVLPENLRPSMVVTIQPGDMVFTVPASITFPNRLKAVPGQLLDLWSINPVTGQFDDVGDMQVSTDGKLIETISGGVRTSSWHFPEIPPRPPKKTPRKVEKGGCPCVERGPANSEIEYQSGSIIETHHLVPYSGLGGATGFTLTYDSQRADPRPIISNAFDFDFLNTFQFNTISKSLTFLNGSFSFNVPGIDNDGKPFSVPQDSHLWLRDASFDEQMTMLQADLSKLPTGRYTTSLRSSVGNYFTSGDSFGQFFGSFFTSTEKLIHVNGIQSPFGSGWGITGVQQIFKNRDGSVLLVDGDGSELIFEPINATRFNSPAGDFSVLERLSNGTLRRTLVDKTVYSFDAADRLVKVQDRNGNVVQYIYDANGLLFKIIDPVGLTTIFTAQNGRIISIKDPANRTTKLDYDIDGNLISVTDPDGSKRTWGYDSKHHIVTEIDKRGNREETFYNFSGRAIRSVLKDGSELRYSPMESVGLLLPSSTQNKSDLPTALPLLPAESGYLDANGNVHLRQVDSAGLVTSQTDAIGPGTSHVRDASNRSISSRDSRGNNVGIQFDDLGNILQIRDSITTAKIYVIGGTQNPFVVASLSANGFDVTVGATASDWNGTQETLSAFDAVLLLPSGFGGMPEEGQTAIANYVNAGGGVLAAEPFIRFVVNPFGALDDIMPARSGPTTQGFRSIFTESVRDPIITAGVPASFTFDEIAFSMSLDARQGAKTFFKTPQNRGGLVGKDVGSGRVIAIAGSLDDFELSQIEMQKLIANAIIWSTKDDSLGVANFTYDPTFNRVTSSVDGDGRRTLMNIDPANGNVRSLTQVVGSIGNTDDVTTQFTYTTRGLVDTITDALGRITDFDYDLLGRLVKVTTAKGLSLESNVRLEYNTVSNGPVASLDELGRRTEYQYDVMGRLVNVIQPDPDGAGPQTKPTTAMTYDLAGNLTSTTDALGNVTRYEYDTLNRNIKSIDAQSNVSSTVYDHDGNVVLKTDPLGNKVQNVYDSRNRLIESLDPLGGRTRYEYDGNNNLVKLTDPANNPTSYLYDARNRVIQKTDPLGAKTILQYDNADHVVQTIDRRNNRIDRTYDDLGRMTLERWTLLNGLNTFNPITRSYDKLGNVLRISDFFSVLTFQYDARNRVTSVDNTGSQRTTPVVLNYSYDATSNVVAVAEKITGANGATTNYTYDALNRRIRQSQSGVGTSAKRVDLAYDAMGQIKSIDRFSDLAGTQKVAVTSFSFDTLNRLTSLTHKKGLTTLDFENVAYDVASRITSITDVKGKSDYSYDKRSQLVGADHARANLADELYTYDINGNRIKKSEGTQVSSPTTGTGNRLLSDGKFNYQYDGEGNMTRRTEIATGIFRLYSYDHRNRLTFVRERDATDTNTHFFETHTYDALDRRIGKYSDPTPDHLQARREEFIYDGMNVLLDFTDPDGDPGPEGPKLTHRYLFGPAVDQVFAQDGGNGDVQWYLQDHLGSTTDLIDSSGVVKKHFVYDSFGNIKQVTDGSGNAKPLTSEPSTRYLFTGREYNTQTDTYYYRARFYDPAIGRFMSEDPIGFAGGDVNLFRYVENAAINVGDPYGLSKSKQYAVWVEGPNKNEPSGHLSIAIGELNGHYRSYSFGATGGLLLGLNGPGFVGQVYVDNDKGGMVYQALYRTLSEQEAISVDDVLQRQVQQRADYTGANTCRTFSLGVFELLEEKGIGKHANAPERVMQKKDANGKYLNLSEWTGESGETYMNPLGLQAMLIRLYGGR